MSLAIFRTFRSANLALAPDETTANYDETTWTYNNRNQLQRKQYADGKGTDYTYTPGGKLLTRTWARGITTTYGYNSAGELTTTDYSDTTPDVTITPDKLGRQQSVTNGVATSVFAYDPANLALDTETISYDLNGDNTPDFTRVLDRSRDNLGRDTGYTLGTPSPSLAIETQAKYQYSATTGRLAQISNPQISNHQFTYGYESGSSLIASVTGPAHTVTNQYEPTRDVLSSKENKAGTTTISKYDYTVNAIGQRTNVTTSGTAFPATPSWAWGYDSLGQVITADSSVNTSDRAYQYDAIGNRKKSADSLTLPGSDNYTSNALNQYSSIGNPQSTIVNPLHDFDGNLTSGQLPTGSAGLVWDAENRLIAVNVLGQDTIHYAYDAQSRRISRNVGTETTLYVHDAWNVIAEYSGPSLSKTYLWGTDLSGNLQGSGGVGGLLSVQIHNPQSAIYYPTYDGNGNVSEYLAADGSTAAHFEYDPFGNTVVNTDTSNLFAYRFSTKPLDQVTGLYYYGYRWYDPATGRWPSRDPIEEEGGLNLYAFVGNDGVNQWDLLGLAWSMKGTIEEDARRLWKRKDTTKDTEEDLAKKVKLDPQEFSKWARAEEPSKCGLKNTETGCCFSVPNVFLVSDLMGYDKADDAIITTFGGRLGNLFTQAPGKKKVAAKNAADMHAALKKYAGDLWGFAVYAHGNEDGDLVPTRRWLVDGNEPVTTAVKIYKDLKANGFQLSKVWMMQCYSGANGRNTWWDDVSYRKQKYYLGVNKAGVDFK